MNGEGGGSGGGGSGSGSGSGVGNGVNNNVSGVGGLKSSPRRLADTAKIDYHNTVRKTSIVGGLPNPVGHPSALDSLMQQSSWADSLDRSSGGGGGERKEGTRIAASTVRAPPTTAMTITAPAMSATAAGTRTGEQGGWQGRVLGGKKRGRSLDTTTTTAGPIIEKARGRNSAPGKSAGATATSASTSATKTLPPKPTFTSHQHHSRTAMTGSTVSSSRPSGGRVWLGAAHEVFREPPIAISGLPKQLAVPGGFLFGDERGEYYGAGSSTKGGNSSGGSVFGPAGRRQLHQSRRRGGGGGGGRGGASSSRYLATGGGIGAAAGGAAAVADLNNLHPAWRPKGIIRRQNAVSKVEER